MWEHKPGKHNQVVDVLSCKQVQEYVTTLTRVEPDFVERIKEERKKRGQSSRNEVSSFSFAYPTKPWVVRLHLFNIAQKLKKFV